MSRVFPVSDSRSTWERPCHLLQSWLSSCHHLSYAQYWICIWLRKEVAQLTLSFDRHWFFFLPISPSSTLREYALSKSILHEAWLSIQSHGGSNSPAHTCSACPLPLCCAPWSPGGNSFWMFPERQEQYSTTDLTPGAWIEYTKSNKILMH